MCYNYTQYKYKVCITILITVCMVGVHYILNLVKRWAWILDKSRNFY